MKHKSIGALKKEVDKWFSLYVRERDADRLMEDMDGDSKPAGKCITCPKVRLISKMDAGHFIGRTLNILRYHKKNVNLQCKGCNGYGNGQQYKHGRAIAEKYSPTDLQEILDLEEQHKGKVYMWKRWELEDMIEEFKQLYREEKRINEETLWYSVD